MDNFVKKKRMENDAAKSKYGNVIIELAGMQKVVSDEKYQTREAHRRIVV